MDPRLLEYYNRELQFVRETGAEFAQAYPRIAARLGVEGLQCTDPYVERLLESFAFLTARVQLKLDARHPDFTQHLLELVYPHALCPVPACAIVELAPDLTGGLPPTGQVIPKGTSLRTPLGKGDRTVVEFRTAHEVTLWPVEVTEVRYLVGSSVLSSQGLSQNGAAQGGPVRGALRIRLKAAPGVELKSLRPERLTFFIKATATVAALLYEQIAADCTGFHARSTRSGAAVHTRDAKSVRTVGLEDGEALLPVTRSGFQGYRLLQEYFTLPERLLFFTLEDLGGVFAQAQGDELEFYIGLARTQAALENAVATEHLRLGCTPAINLFSRAADRIHMSAAQTEMHLVPDRNRPMDFEVFSIDRVQAIGANGQRIADVERFYSGHHLAEAAAARMYYTMQRYPRKISTRQREIGTRSAYVGSECFVSIVDSAQRHFRGDIHQLEVQTTCTNRDLPVLLAAGQGPTDFHVEGGGPIESVRCIVGPTFPRASAAFGDTAWKLISQLSLNYLSLVEHGSQGGAPGVPQMLCDLLALYTDPNDPAHTRQVEGVRGVSYRPVVRRVPIPGPMSYGRGLEISLTLDDAAFEGLGIVPLGSVLEQFFARYVSLNSFTQTRLRSASRGEIKTWPVRLGRRPLA
jgi:type VI secretion system protein ImpG